MTPETPFLIGSVTKSFTALAIMQLSEAGRVQLDAPVQRYLPWWRVADPDASTRITVPSSAVPGQRAVEGDGQRVRDQRGHPRLRPRGPGPGAARRRTHPAGWHDLAVQQRQLLDLGMIVQAVSGQSYETYIQQHIFDPLQMRNSYTSGPRRCSTACPRATATGTASRRLRLPFDRGGLGSRGLSSSAQDMTRYLSLYLNHGRHGATALVSPAGAAELQRAGSRPAWTASLRDGLGRGPDPRHDDDLPRRQRLRLPRKRRPHPRPPVGRRGDGERRELPDEFFGSRR